MIAVASTRKTHQSSVIISPTHATCGLL